MLVFFMEMPKFTTLQMYSSLIFSGFRRSTNITHNSSWFWISDIAYCIRFHQISVLTYSGNHEYPRKYHTFVKCIFSICSNRWSFINVTFEDIKLFLTKQDLLNAVFYRPVDFCLYSLLWLDLVPGLSKQSILLCMGNRTGRYI